MRSRALLLAAFSFVVFAHAPTAQAFWGFYASRSASSPHSESSMIVVMREGDRSVVSLRSDYHGPREDFALVVPVPASIERERVRTLRPDAFERIDRLSAPRLVEYWERDPCSRARPTRGGAATGGGAWAGNGSRPPTVTEPARFSTDGYDVEVLDAPELGRWLRRRGYRAPAGMEDAARPYVEAGYRFLVAPVDASRLSFEDGRAVLPPLRFQYRSDELALPIRLGRLGATGSQDLVVLALSRERRQEVANRVNVLAPTNLQMLPRARRRFDEVYATLFDRVVARHPGAVVTEYAWSAQSCDACPAEALGDADLDTFGRDVLGPASGDERFVLTRLHARLDEPPTSDLVLVPAAPIAGGRGRPFRSGILEHRIDRAPRANAFQARYAILHAWNRPVTCASPIAGRWGAPPRRRRPAAIAAQTGAAIIPTGQLRRFVHTWSHVLRIPARGDAQPATLR